MPTPDFAQHIQISFLDSATRARMKQPAEPRAAETGPPLSFDDLVDIVNPLQHIPIVSTLYQHYANDPISPAAEIAGGALYGGPAGFAGAVADCAFQKITGKSFGATVLGWVTGDDKAASTAVASTAPGSKAGAAALPHTAAPQLASSTMATHLPSPLAGAAVAPTAPAAGLASLTGKTPPQTGQIPAGAPNAQVPVVSQAALDALMASLNHNNPDSDTNSRMIDAYRKTMQLGSELPPGPVAIH